VFKGLMTSEENI